MCTPMSITGRLIERQNGLTAINIVNITRLWNELYWNALLK